GWSGNFTQWYDINNAEGHSAQDGVRFINLIGATGANVLSQSFGVVAGGRYTVNYYEMRRAVSAYMHTTLSVAAGTVAGTAGTPTSVSTGPDASIVQKSATGNDAWTLHSFTFTPNTTTTATLTLENHYTPSVAGDNDGVFLDNVTLAMPPVSTLINSPATGVNADSAVLNATLSCSGTNYSVYSHWNTVNGGTNAALWTNSVYIGSWTNVASTNLSYLATGLVPGTTYYFTFRGINAGGNLWAPNVYTVTVLGSQTPTQPQTITFAPLSAKTYGDAPFGLTATASSGLTVSYESSDTNVATVVSNLVTILNAGGTTLTASQAGDANYSAADPVPQTLTVNKAGQTITFGALAPKTYGDAPFSLTATASSGLAVSYASSDTNVATVAGSTVTLRKGGSTVITATQAGDANRFAAVPVPQTLTVFKATPVLTWNAPAAITVGTALGSNQLNAACGGVAGTFTYTPPAGTVLPAGVGQTLSVSFTPADTESYNSPADKQVAITVTATFLAEDFEHEWADNALANTANGWTSGAADRSSITNPSAGFAASAGRVPFPLGYDHTLQRRLLSLNTGGVLLDSPPAQACFSNTTVYVDMMVKFEASQGIQVAETNNPDLKTAVLLLADGAATNLCVFHGQRAGAGFGAPVFSAVTNQIAPATWCRLTVDLCSTAGAEAFRVQINGQALFSPVAYGDDWKSAVLADPYAPPSGGTWFLSAARRAASAAANPDLVGNVGFIGTGGIDDLVVSFEKPDFTFGTVFMLTLSTDIFYLDREVR
ncbi:MAG: hypothetical protein WCK89_21885, partial [bacterium]